MLFCSSVSAQITVTHFNAEWNAANKVEWFDKLDDCELAKVDIVEQPKLQDKHKIIIVPTIVVNNAFIILDRLFYPPYESYALQAS